MQNRIFSWSCSTVVERKDKIDPNPVYQRGPVWRLDQQQRLIDSILRGYDIPKLYFFRRGSVEPYEHDVTDGQQRLLAIWRFFANEYPLGADSEDVPNFGDLSGILYSDLPEGAQDRLKLFHLTICEITDATETEVRELFLRLQEGASLNPAEKRNAMLGGMRDFVARLGEEHPVFPLTRISNSRFGWHNLAAHVVRLELAEGPADTKASDLRQMYEEYVEFGQGEPAARRTEQVLDYMTRVLHSQPREMSIKWGFVDLYLAISRLLHRTDVELENQEQSFLLMFEAFEKQRLAVEDPADLLGAHPTENEEYLYKYIDSFTKEGATKKNIERRHQVYLWFLSAEIPTSRDEILNIARSEVS